MASRLNKCAKRLNLRAACALRHGIGLDVFVEMPRQRDMRSQQEMDEALRPQQSNLLATSEHAASSHFEIVLALVLRDKKS
ncbi:hypothetical protein [Cupriavidus sp. PET2-C1]